MDNQTVLDIGCGMSKLPGAVGFDFVKYDCVDHVLDITKDHWPVADNSVDKIYSSHFFEHFDHGHKLHFVLREIGRVCKEGATIEIWTPHARGKGAFLPGHVAWLNEYMWLALCGAKPNVWHESMCGAWLLNEIRFQVIDDTRKGLVGCGMDLCFAVRHLENVIEQFGAFATFTKTPTECVPRTRMTLAGNNKNVVISEIARWGRV